MPAIVDDVDLRSEGAPPKQRYYDLSGTGNGPWIPLVISSDLTGAPVAPGGGSAPVVNLGAAAVATVIARMLAAGSVSLSKAKWPGPYTVTGGLPAVGGGGISTLTETGVVVGAVFAPAPTWGGVILDFAGVGGADLSPTVEIGRVALDATMPTVLGNATALKSITTAGTFTANFNPFTGAAVATTTYRLFDLVTLNSLGSQGQLMVDTGGTENETPARLRLDVTAAPYYYVLLRGLATMTEVMAAITPQP